MTKSTRWFLGKGFIILILLLSSSTVHSQVLRRTPNQLDQKIQKAESRFDEIQKNRETRIPEFVLKNAIGIIIVQQFKVGVGVGAEGGGGVAMVKDRKTGHWSPPAFIANVEGSYGFQVGAQNATTVFCIMNPEGLKILLDGGLKIGVDVRATAGPASAGGEAMIDDIKSPILVYSSKRGLFSGVAIEGGGIIKAERKNLTYYNMNMERVLFSGLARWTTSNASLVNKVRLHAGEFRTIENNLLNPSTRVTGY